MGQKTQPFKRSMSGSIGSGMKSVFGGDGRRFYVLEHKVSSKYHKAGEEQKIIVDQIEIGRDPNCAVRLDGDPNDKMFQIVSRKHAAIQKEGDNWVLIHLSNTNSTFLNGRRMSAPGQKWYLQNGDEIQIAESGPKMGFKIPQGDKGLVKSIGLTARLNLFRQQALRPYKHGIVALACLLVLVSSVGGFVIFNQQEELKNAEQRVAEFNEERIQNEQQLKAIIDSVSRENATLKDNLADANKALENLDKVVKDMPTKIIRDVRVIPPTPTPDNSEIYKAMPHVFFIQTQKYELIQPNGEKEVIQWTNGQNKEMDKKFSALAYTGTGFLTSDGRFITARHVAEGWYFWVQGRQVNEAFLQLNLIANNGGKVVAHFIAVSSSGKQLSFTSNQFKVTRSTDENSINEDGDKISLAQPNNTDWAYINISGGGLNVNNVRSSNLKRNEHLEILGFPLGLGANSPSDIKPMSSEAKTAHEGLQNGVIITTATTFEQGNSGGPVFAIGKNNELEVIGIVSAGAGRSTGFVVPVSIIK